MIPESPHTKPPKQSLWKQSDPSPSLRFSRCHSVVRNEGSFRPAQPLTVNSHCLRYFRTQAATVVGSLEELAVISSAQDEVASIDRRRNSLPVSEFETCLPQLILPRSLPKCTTSYTMTSNMPLRNSAPSSSLAHTLVSTFQPDDTILIDSGRLYPSVLVEEVKHLVLGSYSGFQNVVKYIIQAGPEEGSVALEEVRTTHYT